MRSETSEGSTTAAKGVHRKAPVGKAGPPGSRKRVDTLTPKVGIPYCYDDNRCEVCVCVGSH